MSERLSREMEMDETRVGHSLPSGFVGHRSGSFPHPLPPGFALREGTTGGVTDHREKEGTRIMKIIDSKSNLM